MYEAFFQLNEKPFALTPSVRYIYLADQCKDARAKCLYFLNQRSASIYLYGPIGSGKTYLLRMMAQELTEAELRVLLYIARRTFGFKKTGTPSPSARWCRASGPKMAGCWTEARA